MTEPKKIIELLAPAKNLETGIAAIDCGADAVYVGAPKFGARSAAGNSLQDIEELVKYAHKFWAKVYVTINTILYENELDEVEKLAEKLHHIGVDAIIFQDMALLEMNLPPFPLHASTQTNNYEPDRIKFLSELGLQRIILARELSIEQIREIRSETKAELEYFIHGALCVCFSGQCYLSQHLTGRSANRGECAQPCRMQYTLEDKNGKVIVKDRHLLSLKDLNSSTHISELLDAGISSFKIEGRLKDISYVKNITAYYRQLIDSILEVKTGYVKSSSGTSQIPFEPDPQKSFNRGFTEYFVTDVRENRANINSPKSTGELLGNVKALSEKYFELDTSAKIINGDGLCFFDSSNNLTGFNVSRVEGNKIFHSQSNGLRVGIEIFRNYDKKFNDSLNHKIVRKIEAVVQVESIGNQLVFNITDEDKNKVSFTVNNSFEPAQNSKHAIESMKKQLSKSGNTIFSVTEIAINEIEAPFIPVKILNEIRRSLLIALEEERIKNYPTKVFEGINKNVLYPTTKLSYKGNVTNSLSRRFYQSAGVTEIESGFELEKTHSDNILMTCKYCIREELDICVKDTEGSNEDLFLTNNNKKFRVKFNCQKCQMEIRSI